MAADPKPASAPRTGASRAARRQRPPKPELVIITGLSGSGKGSVLKALEDLGYYSVDNLPVELIPKFAELTRDNSQFRPAALVVDIREGEGLKRFPEVFAADPRSGKGPADFSGGGRCRHRAPLQRNPPPAPAGHRSVHSQEASSRERANWRPSAPWRT